jgi:hypothetical protein
MTDQQLADRLEATELSAWENDFNFQQLLLSCESILPLRLPSQFRDPKVHQRILSLSEGVLVRICRIIEIAATEAVHSGQEHITLACSKTVLSPDLWSRSLTVATGEYRHDDDRHRAASTAVRSETLRTGTLFFMDASGRWCELRLSSRTHTRLPIPPSTCAVSKFARLEPIT